MDCPKCGWFYISYLGYCPRCKSMIKELYEKHTGKSITWDDELDFHNEIKVLLSVISDKGYDYICTEEHAYIIKDGKVITIGKRIKKEG